MGTDEYKEARFAAGINFELEEITPFLTHISHSILDSGLSSEEIRNIQLEIEAMDEDNQIKQFGTFDVGYQGKRAKIRIEAEIHIEDEDKEVVLYMHSSKELVDVLNNEMRKFVEQREIQLLREFRKF